MSQGTVYLQEYQILDFFKVKKKVWAVLPNMSSNVSPLPSSAAPVAVSLQRPQ